jgi:predicted nucleic-acid-binding protein
MIGLDTNIVVRYLTRDDEGQFAKARQLLAGELTAADPGYISRVVLAEIAWVLTGSYDLDRATLAEVLERLLTSRQLVVQDAETAYHALRTYRSGRGDFVDLLIVEQARRAGCVATATFDRRAAKQPGFQLLA